MNGLAYLVLAIAKLLGMIINIYTFVVAAAVIITWVRPDPNNPIVRILYQLTEPAFRLARRILPRALYRTGLDFAPLLVFFALVLIDTVVVGFLFDLAQQMSSP
jgi:YggT family protein